MSNQELTRVMMVRDDLEDLPEYELCEGFEFGYYQAGYERYWVEIHRLADEYNDADEALFRKEFGEGREEPGRRQLYLFDDNSRAVGTATAWYDNKVLGVGWGRVHWVAIIPEYQGRGLAKPLLGAVLARLKELGHDKALLGTQLERVAAVNLYLKFGFRPVVRSMEELEKWRLVRDSFKVSFDLPSAESLR